MIQTFLKLILAILLVGGAAGGFLYHNFQQNEEFRPFRGYSDEGLKELADAYGEQFEVLDGRYQKLSENRAKVQEHDYLGEKVQEFERMQAIGKRTREAGQEVSFVMSAQKDLKRELWIRQHPIQHFWDTASDF